MISDKSLSEYIKGIPKAELHVHIEGTLEPELMFEFAERNGIKIKYKSVQELREAYNFNNLQEFLDIYYAGASVLLTEQDFFDMTCSYLQKAHSQNVIHAEIFFDPQSHTSRGISFDTVIKGIHRALEDGKTKFGISSKLIPCFLRHLDSDSAMETLKTAGQYKDWITAFGLDSSEKGNPPLKFQKVFDAVREAGFLTVAHAGEEGPAEYVWEAIDVLKVSRIDHGNRSLDDASLVEYLSREKIPLTVCPLSNLKLKVVKDLKKHPLKEMMKRGVMVTINSDDPAYFGGYVGENYMALADSLDLNREEIYQLVQNSFTASFLNDDEKKIMVTKAAEFNFDFNPV
ncbi:MAG: adenosine deaminase [Ignavibacteriae bacterium HGW-Ignavibacteriae-3]|nr:MAG: adenosine deaminase [Ignavibacteriae bacterium HGW-Ignavibacteriae-3]